MAKHLVVFVFGALVFGPAARGQFGGANIAANIGAAAGRRISDQINTSLRQGTRGFGTGGNAKQGKGAGPAGAGVPKAQEANIPPPPPPAPPLRRVVTTKKLTAPSWVTGASPMGPPPPLNVDLALIERGMARESLLALGKPSSKVTLYEDGHMVEIYQYRNQTLVSGTVRLRDGAVSAIEARP